MDPSSLRHLNGLRDFIRTLVEQAERSGGCECHRPPSLLLVGPPGAGKTYLVKQMSTICEMPLFGVHTHQLTGPHSLRNLFEQARGLDYPSLFFLDDVEYIFSNQDLRPGQNPLAEALREELYKQLGPRKLKIFDSNSSKNPVQSMLPNTPSGGWDPCSDQDRPDNNGLILVAATNAPWMLYKDHELLSRFRGVYLVGLPDREARFHMIKNLLQKVQHNLTEKDLWLVADKTEGFTPSDLMIVTKSLNYEQLSFLFSMAGLRGYDGESSDEDSLSSSELTETDMESNYEQDNADEPPASKAATESLAKEEDGNRAPDKDIELSKQQESKQDGQGPTLEILAHDWSDEEEKENPETNKDDKTDKKDANHLSNEIVDDTATLTSLPSEQDEGKGTEPLQAPADALKPSSEPSDCDSSSNILNKDTECMETPISSPEPPSFPLITRTSGAEPDMETPKILVTEPNSDDETKEFELHVFQPAEPFPNDNQAVDSGSDTDNETGGDFNKRTRPVNFCSVPSLHPLTVDVDNVDDLAPNNSLGFDPAVSSISSGMENNLLSKDPYNCSPSANNILKRLLSSSPTIHDDIDDDNLNSKNNRNKEVSSIVKNDTYHQNDYLDDYSNSNLRRSPIGHDETDSCRTRKENNKSQDLQTFPRNPSILRNNLSEDRRSLTGVSPQLTGVSAQLTGVSPQLARVSPQLTGVSPQLTPTGSDISSHLATDNSSESGSGRRVRINISTAEREKNKTRDSNSSLDEKYETPTIPSSDMSTATSNASGETLACHSDSEERLQNLEDDLKQRRPPRSSDDDDDVSADDNINDRIEALFNINNLGEVSIKIITINDVLNVVNRTPRSVSDEEIKRYTDFLQWFANVARTACPHNSKGATSDSASSADVSVDSSLWSHSTATKKRRGPLKKLGRFLLKALMFILD